MLKKIYKKDFLCLLISLTTLLVSCQIARKPAANSSTIPNLEKSLATETSKSQYVALSETIKFKLKGGSDTFSLKPMPNGAKLLDAAEKEIARFAVSGNKLKIKNAADEVLGYVIKKDGYWKIENAAQTQDLYILRPQEGGNYQLEDGANKQIYRVQMRDYGLEIESPNKQSLYKVKAKEGKIFLRDTSDKTFLYTKSEFSTIALACFGFEEMGIEQQAALAYALNQSGG